MRTSIDGKDFYIIFYDSVTPSTELTISYELFSVGRTDLNH